MPFGLCHQDVAIVNRGLCLRHIRDFRHKQPSCSQNCCCICRGKITRILTRCLFNNLSGQTAAIALGLYLGIDTINNDSQAISLVIANIFVIAGCDHSLCHLCRQSHTLGSQYVPTFTVYVKRLHAYLALGVIGT